MTVRRTIGSLLATLALGALLLTPSTAAADTGSEATVTTAQASSTVFPPGLPRECYILPIVCQPFPPVLP